LLFPIEFTTFKNVINFKTVFLKHFKVILNVSLLNWSKLYMLNLRFDTMRNRFLSIVSWSWSLIMVIFDRKGFLFLLLMSLITLIPQRAIFLLCLLWFLFFLFFLLRRFLMELRRRSSRFYLNFVDLMLRRFIDWPTFTEINSQLGDNRFSVLISLWVSW
jgi:hypothetical protein